MRRINYVNEINNSNELMRRNDLNTQRFIRFN